MTEPTLVIPGQDLGPSSTHLPGAGTHLHNSRIHASILGRLHLLQPSKPTGPQKRLTKITPAEPLSLPTISVVSSSAPLPADADAKGGQAAIVKAQVIPEVGSEVLCKVTRITPRQATVAILIVGEAVLDGEWQGIIRVQDVRATEKDKVKIFESFRPGDTVRAVVVSPILLPLLLFSMK